MIVPKSLIVRLHGSEKEHVLLPEELDAIKDSLLPAIMDASWVTAVEKRMIDSHGHEHLALEIRIIIKLQADVE